MLKMTPEQEAGGAAFFWMKSLEIRKANCAT